MKFELWTSQAGPNSTSAMYCVSLHSSLTVSETLPKCVLFCSQRSQLSLIPLIQDFQRGGEIFFLDSRAWIPTRRRIETPQEFGYVVLMQSDN